MWSLWRFCVYLEKWQWQLFCGNKSLSPSCEADAGAEKERFIDKLMAFWALTAKVPPFQNKCSFLTYSFFKLAVSGRSKQHLFRPETTLLVSLYQDVNNGSLYLHLPCPTQFDHSTNLVLPIYKVSQINSTNLISSTNLAPEFSSAST